MMILSIEVHVLRDQGIGGKEICWEWFGVWRAGRMIGRYLG